MDENGNIVSINFNENNRGVLLCGQTGSGRSNLVNTIITSICTQYNTIEAKVSYVDFKGVEAKLYEGEYKYPNLLQVMQLKSEEEFIDVLSNVGRIYNDRKALFEENGYDSIKDVEGEKLKKVPRIIVILDEFTVIKSEFTLSMLKGLFKSPIDAGIYFIFATQDWSNSFYDEVTGKLDKIALHCNKETSMKLIGNESASELPNCGFCIYNGGKSQNTFPKCRCYKGKDENIVSKT